MSVRSDALIRIRQKFPLTGKGPAAVSGLVLRILEDDRLVQRILLETDKPVLIDTLVPPDHPLATVEDFHDIVRNRPMVEYLDADNKRPVEQVFEMMRMVTDEKLKVGFVLTGDTTRFNRWLKQPLLSSYVAGAELRQASRIPSDVFLVCGVAIPDPMPADIVISIKGALP